MRIVLIFLATLLLQPVTARAATDLPGNVPAALAAAPPSGGSAPAASLEATVSERLDDSPVLATLRLRFCGRFPDGPAAYNTENEAELGWRLSPTASVSYWQEFFTNLSDPTGTQSGLNPVAGEGYFRAQVEELWSPGSGFFLAYQPRVYAPTDAEQSRAGMVTMLGQGLVLRKQLGESVRVSLREMPAVPFHGRSGYQHPDDGLKAVPVFYNELSLELEASALDGKLNFYLALNLDTTHFGDLDGAANSGQWEHFLWINPEVTYNVTPEIAVGVGYYSDDGKGLMTPTLGEFQLGESLRRGVFHGIVHFQI